MPPVRNVAGGEWQEFQYIHPSSVSTEEGREAGRGGVSDGERSCGRDSNDNADEATEETIRRGPSHAGLPPAHAIKSSNVGITAVGATVKTGTASAISPVSSKEKGGGPAKTVTIADISGGAASPGNGMENAHGGASPGRKVEELRSAGPVTADAPAPAAGATAAVNVGGEKEGQVDTIATRELLSKNYSIAKYVDESHKDASSWRPLTVSVDYAPRPLVKLQRYSRILQALGLQRGHSVGVVPSLRKRA